MPNNKNRKKSPKDSIIKRNISKQKLNQHFGMLSGFVGNAPDKGFVRLYVNSELSEFVDIRDSDIVEKHSLKSEANPLGGSVLWVKASAQLHYTKIESKLVQADFLKGSFTDQKVHGSVTDAGAFVFFKKIPGVKSIPPQVSVCFSCPAPDGGGSLVCTLTPSCIKSHNPCPNV